MAKAPVHGVPKWFSGALAYAFTVSFFNDQEDVRNKFKMPHWVTRLYNANNGRTQVIYAERWVPGKDQMDCSWSIVDEEWFSSMPAYFQRAMIYKMRRLIKRQRTIEREAHRQKLLLLLVWLIKRYQRMGF